MSEQPRPGPPLKEHIAAEVDITLAEVGAGVYGKLDEGQIRDRVERTKAYAKWRWQGYMAGQITSL